jgi:CBS domain-containing protein
MRVDGLLRMKGSDVVTVAPTATLSEAAKTLAELRIGALLVLDGRRQVQGIVSERDIVACLASHGNQALNMRVSDVMSSDVVTCSSNDTLDQLMTVMTERRIRHLPVVDNGGLTGIISIGDVVKLRLSEVADEAKALSDYITLGR